MNTALQHALVNAGVAVPPIKEPVTPWNPSRRAIQRVKNPLPAPECCPNCSSPVELVGNEKIYSRAYGEWPWAYRCTSDVCDSYVGLHPFTAIPLGTLANYELREARKAAKAVFNPLWQGGSMNRTQAYDWLAQVMRVPVGEAHIGWFDATQCAQVRRQCHRYAEAMKGVQ